MDEEASGRAGDNRPAPEDIIRYEKDPRTRIATITFDRPDHLNAPTTAARVYYGDLIHRASLDDEVKVLVIRGAGDDFGSGADLPEYMEVRADPDPARRLGEFGIAPDEDVRFPPEGTVRHGASIGQWYANARAGCRSLQEFKKISIVEVKGYCYGWHFYQAGDADLVISADDALFGHPSFRYYGWGPRMWTWAQTMGMRKFQEMVFTGRAFTAAEMADLHFVNSVVPRADLEAETAKYALACARNRPTDTVFMQKVFFEIMKQQQGEYMGSLLTGFFESMGGRARPDEDELMLDHAFDDGLNNSVKNADARFPPEFRLSKSGRDRATGHDGRTGPD